MLGILDSVIIVISLALVVGAVLRAAGKKQTDAEYFLAGRDLRWPFIGMSLLASNISAEHVVSMAGDGYRVGLVTGGYEWMAAWCLIILASLFTPLYLRSRIYTIPEFLERRFGWALVSDPYLASFLHRSILVWCFAAMTMIAVSLLTAPPAEYKIEGNVFGSGAAAEEQSVGGTDYRIWAGVLFLCTLVLWWTFR